ncbi:MAG: hypothetical protein JWL95_2388, partial [Gemmatimonadetes bacterium]|nr:hypothetical protein [Gemmatimonadota bacterium]
MAVHSPKDPRDPETVPGKVVLPLPVPDAASVNDVSSIDNLLEMTSG